MDGADQARLERRIAGRLDAGDLRSAAEESVRGYGGEVAAYLRAVLHQEAAADEVFSRVCEKLWRGRLGQASREPRAARAEPAHPAGPRRLVVEGDRRDPRDRPGRATQALRAPQGAATAAGGGRGPARALGRRVRRV